ncbi:hypothetical protein D9611_008852 [Ephemerocybe angulata]|uniref:Uncharacterized protein n=1 Tax=Ephemerocybe angulata TaxID=980116 RepID=A0A8H5BZ55_9AGAR|nr:hypothetical protein D9611_008852 [Tulosesus angulatus]
MAPSHSLRHRNTAFRSTVSMFWGWAQTDPAGIHASSAPVHGRWARRRPTNTRTHLVIDAKPNANPDAFRLQEHRVHRKLTLRGFTHPQLQYMDAGPVLYPDALLREFQHIRMPIRTLSGTPRPCSGAGRKLTLRGFTHPQLQDMDVFGGLTRPGIPLATEKFELNSRRKQSIRGSP